MRQPPFRPARRATDLSGMMCQTLRSATGGPDDRRRLRHPQRRCCRRARCWRPWIPRLTRAHPTPTQSAQAQSPRLTPPPRRAATEQSTSPPAPSELGPDSVAEVCGCPPSSGRRDEKTTDVPSAGEFLLDPRLRVHQQLLVSPYYPFANGLSSTTRLGRMHVRDPAIQTPASSMKQANSLYEVCMYGSYAVLVPSSPVEFLVLYAHTITKFSTDLKKCSSSPVLACTCRRTTLRPELRF